MGDALPEDQRLAGISPKAYEHPADRAATAALAQVPMLDTVVKRLIEYGYERALRQALLAGSVRISDDQLPEVYADYRAALSRLDIEPSYDLYLTQFPIANAAVIGSEKPLFVVNSRTIELLDRAEQRTVFGHEAGHILSQHVMYRSALLVLLSLGTSLRLPFLAGLPLLAVQMALLEWYRAAELSCDRAATLVNRDPLVTCRMLMVMAGGVPARNLSLDAFLKQANDYRDWDSGWDRVSRLRNELTLTHAYPVRRVHELMTWVQSGEYDRVVAGEFRRRDDPVDAREEARAARDHYVERFRAIFRDFGEGVSGAGERVGDAAQRVNEWLRQQRRGDSSDS
jgi:Zn-dependent protease with chaperone function